MKQLFMDIEPWAMQECDSRGKGDRQGETAKGQDFPLEMTSGPQHWNRGWCTKQSSTKVNGQRLESWKAKVAGICRAELWIETSYIEK